MRNSGKRIMRLCCLLLTLTLLSCDAASAVGENGYEEFVPSRIIVSMGDSFSSGEGILPFYGQKNALGMDRSLIEKLSDPDWLAHRSTKSWGGRLKLPGISGSMKDHRDDGLWYFVASSGATTHDVRYGQDKTVLRIGLSQVDDFKLMLDQMFGADLQLDYENINVLSLYTPSPSGVFTGTGDLYFGEVTLDAQLDIFDKLRSDNKHTDYIIITMGGNDLGFADIVAKVITSDIDADENKKDEEKRSGLASGTQSLTDMLNEAKASARPGGKVYKDLYGLYDELAGKDENTCVIVAGYPRLFSENIPEAFYDELAGLIFKALAIAADTVSPFPSLFSGLETFISAQREDDDDYWLFDYGVGYGTVTLQEAKEVNEAVMEFNGILEGIVEDLNKNGRKNIFFVDVAEEFNKDGGHGAYSSASYLNPVLFISRSEDLKLDKASAYSIHPNDAGAQAYADCVQKKIDQLEALKRYNYALNRVTLDGSWYEGITDSVKYSRVGIVEYEQNDYCDVTISGYDPENPKAFTASGEGYVLDEIDDSDFMYDIEYSLDAKGNPTTVYTPYYYDMFSDQYVRDDEDIGKINGTFPRDLYDISVMEDALFEDIRELEEYSFTAVLTEEQYKKLGLDLESVLKYWETVKQREAPKPVDYEPLTAEMFTSNDIGAILDFYQDEDRMWNYILYGNDGPPASYTFIPLETTSVTMEIKFNRDMTFDSIVFRTVGKALPATDTEGSDVWTVEREQCFRLSDLPTGEYYSLYDDDVQQDGYDYEDLLYDFIGAWLGY